MKAQTGVKTTVVKSSDNFKRVIIRRDFVKKNILLHCFVAGYQYNDGENIIHLLSKGEPLSLVREENNPHDMNAVAVYTEDHVQLGYVPRIIAPFVADNMDKGVMPSCRIKTVNSNDYHHPHLRLEIVIKVPM